MTKTACIALLGDFSCEPASRCERTLSAIGSEFCWSVNAVSDLGGLEDLCRLNDVVAVLLNARTLDLSWEDALQSVQSIAPYARAVVCYPAPEMHRRREMSDAGAYHTLLLPLDLREVRQSFGFVSAAARGLANKRKVT